MGPLEWAAGRLVTPMEPLMRPAAPRAARPPGGAAGGGRFIEESLRSWGRRGESGRRREGQTSGGVRAQRAGRGARVARRRRANCELLARRKRAMEPRGGWSFGEFVQFVAGAQTWPAGEARCYFVAALRSGPKLANLGPVERQARRAPSTRTQMGGGASGVTSSSKRNSRELDKRK